MRQSGRLIQALQVGTQLLDAGTARGDRDGGIERVVPLALKIGPLAAISSNTSDIAAIIATGGIERVVPLALKIGPLAAISTTTSAIAAVIATAAIIAALPLGHPASGKRTRCIQEVLWPLGAEVAGEAPRSVHVQAR